MTNWSFYSLCVAVAGMGLLALSLLTVMWGAADADTARPFFNTGGLIAALGLISHKLPIKCFG